MHVVGARMDLVGVSVGVPSHAAQTCPRALLGMASQIYPQRWTGFRVLIFSCPSSQFEDGIINISVEDLLLLQQQQLVRIS